MVACVAWFRLLTARQDALRAADVFETSLRTGLGEGYRAELPVDPPPESPLSLRDIWFPRLTERRRYLLAEDLRYGQLGVRNNLDIWRRRNVQLTGGAPVLIQIPGSAWTKGSKRGQGYPLMAHMAERGWVCVAINYSLAPAARWPAHIIDVKRAIAWVKREISQHGGDPDFIGSGIGVHRFQTFVPTRHRSSSSTAASIHSAIMSRPMPSPTHCAMPHTTRSCMRNCPAPSIPSMCCHRCGPLRLSRLSTGS